MSDVITMKEFKKLDIRIGTVAEVEKEDGEYTDAVGVVSQSYRDGEVGA